MNRPATSSPAESPTLADAKPDLGAVRQKSTWSNLKYFARRDLISTSAAILVALLVLVAIFGKWIAPYSAGAQDAMRLLSPERAYPFGTDNYGRDVYSRVILGTRVSLVVGLICVPIGLFVGGGLGLLAGFIGGKFDMVVMRLMDILFGFPSLILAILIAAVLGASLTNAMIAIGIVIIPIFARTARGPVLSVMQREYIESARVVGASRPSLLFRHILPNVATPLIIQATLSFSAAMLDEAALSFLGLGAQPPTPSWGAMLGDARAYFEIAPWMAIFPGVAIALAVLSLNLLGDGLRDYFDPRTRSRL
ncbi:MAG: ABC transporter permease [Thermomicrobiales bacterium]|nr:ABC transporter permease [Thermomicrobiales bacterium]